MRRKAKRYLGAAIAAGVLGSISMVGAQDKALLDQMHSNYDAALAIKSAIIAGSLEGARGPAQQLAGQSRPADLLDQWADYDDAMKAAARDVAAATDLLAAAEATSRLGLACGDCHVANEVTIEFDSVDRPSDKERARPHMERHQWAADRMWEGLIGPSAVAWRRGGNLLFESPLHPEDMGAEDGDEAIITMSRRIHQLAGNATVVSEPAEKGEIYAEFLANCAACHTELSEGP